MISDIFVLFLCNGYSRSFLIFYIFFLLSVFLLIQYVLLVTSWRCPSSMQAECTEKGGNNIHTFVAAGWRVDKQSNCWNILWIKGGRSKNEYEFRWLMPTNKTIKTKAKKWWHSERKSERLIWWMCKLSIRKLLISWICSFLSLATNFVHLHQTHAIHNFF